MLDDNFTGATLGQYELREIIGRGGMAVVYRAHQAALKRDVAVKIVSAAVNQQPGYAERFVREAQTAALLEHSHIVPIYDYGTHEGISYIVMRLLTGGSLSQRIAQREDAEQPLPSVVEVGILLESVSSALQYAHELGIIHRDIKTSNIMFDSRGAAYVVDFGIARLSEATLALTSSGVVVGTPAYMAPEQWRGEDLTPAADQYALGILIYQLLSGRLPYEAPSTYAMMHKHLNETPVPVHTLAANLPPEVSDVLLKALAKAPEQRYPSVSDFAKAFRAAAGTSRLASQQKATFFTYPVKPDPVPTLHTPSSLSRARTPASSTVTPPRRRVGGRAPWYFGIAAILLILIIGGALLATRGGGQETAAVVPSETPTPDGSATPTNPVIVFITQPPTSPAAATDEPAAATDEATSEVTPAASITTPTAAAGETDEAPLIIPTEAATDTATDTETLAPTATHTAAPTDSPIPTDTTAPTLPPTATDTPAPTDTPIPTDTTAPTEAATLTPSNTPPPTNTPTATPGLADLVVSTVTTAPVWQLENANVPVIVTFQVVFRNRGERDSGDFGYQLRVFPDDLIIAQGRVESLAPGQSIQANVQAPFSHPGAYLIHAQADYDEAVPEQSEVNNLGVISLTILPPPTATPTATATPSPTPSATATTTPSPTLTLTPTATTTPSPTLTLTPTATVTPSLTPTLTICQRFDLNGAGGVDVFDVRIVAAAIENPTADDIARYDFDGDGDVDIFDLRRIASEYGQNCDTP